MANHIITRLQGSLPKKLEQATMTGAEFGTTIKRGLDYLSECTGWNGGMPNHQPGDKVGVWTTLEVCATVLSSGIAEERWKRKLSEFALDSQGPDGSWPMADEEIGAVTSTCAGLIASLAISRHFSDLRLKADKALLRAASLLARTQNSDGGWGLVATNKRTFPSHTIFTAYALNALLTASLEEEFGATITSGLDFLVDLQNDDGGWGPEKGVTSNAADTAKVVELLHLTDVARFRSIRAFGEEYLGRLIRSRRPLPVITNTFSFGRFRHTLYQNTPLEMAQLFTVSSQHLDCRNEIVGWLVANQQQDGSWRLRSYLIDEEFDVTIWATAEVVRLLSLIPRSS